MSTVQGGQALGPNVQKPSPVKDTRVKHTIRSKVADTFFGLEEERRAVASPELLQQFQEMLGGGDIVDQHRIKMEKLKSQTISSERTVVRFSRNAIQTELYKPKAVPENGKLVIFCSGSHARSDAMNSAAVNHYTAEGFTVMTFDYRGFGDSEGRPTKQSDIVKDTRAILRYCQKKLHYQPQDMMLHGFSLGSYPALVVAKENPGISRVVLDHPMKSTYAVAKENAPHSTASKVLGKLGSWVNDFDNKRILQASFPDIPLYIIAGVDDPKFSQAESLVATANESSLPVEFLPVSGKHFDTEVAFYTYKRKLLEDPRGPITAASDFGESTV